MLKAARMNYEPNHFIPILAKKHGVSEKTMWRDWQRRKGLNGWIIKLAALGDVYNVISTHLIDNKLKQGELEKASVEHVSLSMKATVSAELRALRAEERDIMGILPLVQQPTPVITPEEVEEIKVKLTVDQFMNMMKSVSPRLTNEWVRAAVDMPESLEREIEDERKRYEELIGGHP